MSGLILGYLSIFQVEEVRQLGSRTRVRSVDSETERGVTAPASGVSKQPIVEIKAHKDT